MSLIKEETEVKKDLNWFKEQLEDIEMNTPMLWSHDSIWMLDRVNELLNQLDEPEVLSQECIEQKSIDNHVDTLNGEVQFTFKLEDLQNLIVPKQEDINKEKQEAYVKGFEAGEKQTVEFYEEHESKDFNKKVNQLIKAIENPKRIKLRDVIERMDVLSEKNRNDWIERVNERYEVETEQKYYVLDSEDIPLLEIANNQTCKTTTGLSIYEDGRDNSRFELTEQEIKDYDEKFWPFAVKVEELE